MSKNHTVTLNALAQIRSVLPSLATAERTVADWLLQEPERVIRMSISQVATACDVSEPTVIRFSRRAGFHGFRDLKLSIARDTARPVKLIHDRVNEEDDVGAITAKVFASNIQALRDTLDLIDTDTVMQAVELLWNARKILITGVGTSSPIVYDMYNKLFRIGLNCQPVTDSYLQLMEAALLDESDVLVGISHSGESIDPSLTMQQAKKNGVKTLCITGNKNSAITQHADVTLLSVSTETRTEAIASRIAQFTIVDVLYISLSMRDMERAVTSERKANEAVIPKTI